MNLRGAFALQAENCAALGSPFMERLMTLCSERLRPDRAVTEKLFDWPGDPGPDGDGLPLRFAGALHALKLRREDRMAAAWPPEEAGDEAVWSAVEWAIDERSEFISEFLRSPPQTNEVRRSAALLSAAAEALAVHEKPLVISELGASAGLNLCFDRYALAEGGLGSPDPALSLTPEIRGRNPRPAKPRIVDAEGVDLRPADRGSQAGQNRLLAYLWPDQPDRERLTRAAMRVADWPVVAGDAAGWLEKRLARKRPGHLHLVTHTIAWQYFNPETRARCLAAMGTAGAVADSEAPLGRIAMESDDSTPGARLDLTLWPGGETRVLGRVDHHGRWIDLI